MIIQASLVLKSLRKHYHKCSNYRPDHGLVVVFVCLSHKITPLYSHFQKIFVFDVNVMFRVSNSISKLQTFYMR